MYKINEIRSMFAKALPPVQIKVVEEYLNMGVGDYSLVYDPGWITPIDWTNASGTTTKDLGVDADNAQYLGTATITMRLTKKELRKYTRFVRRFNRMCSKSYLFKISVSTVPTDSTGDLPCK